MYKMPYYTSSDTEEVLFFMKSHPFITLIGFDGDYPVATQIPIKVSKEGESIKLIGHIMTKTDHGAAFKKNPNVLVLFTGIHSYISAAVYEKPNVASTWNYKSVQAKGIIKLLSAEETYEIIKDITDKYENPNTSPSAFQKMDEAYIRQHLKAITGFEIMVTDLAHVFKMSQDHTQKDKENMVENLSQKEDTQSQEMAKEMKTYI